MSRISSSKERALAWVDVHSALMWGVIAFIASTAIIVAIFIATSSYIRLNKEIHANRALTAANHRLAVEITKSEHSSTQQNVSARYSDCESSEQTRAALRAQARASIRANKQLAKVFPQLNTPAILRIVAKRQAAAIKAYSPRDCAAYALSAVPEPQRSFYVVP